MGKASDLFRPDRYRSAARAQAGRTNTNHGNDDGSILPLHRSKTGLANETGGLSEKDGRGSPAGSRAGGDGGNDAARGAVGVYSGLAQAAADHEIADAIPEATPPPAPPPIKSEDAGAGNAALESTEGTVQKPTLKSRFIAGNKRFGQHTKNALFHSWVNVLLIFVPIGIAVEAIHAKPAIVFALNAVAIVPLAGLLSHATESVASRMGDTLGALLNVSFGNAVELIIFIIALVKNEIQIVQASLLGSILANLLLILGMAFLFGGLRYREQLYNSTVTQMSACLLSLSVMSLLLPVSFLRVQHNSGVRTNSCVYRLPSTHLSTPTALPTLMPQSCVSVAEQV